MTRWTYACKTHENKSFNEKQKKWKISSVIVLRKDFKDIDDFVVLIRYLRTNVKKTQTIQIVRNLDYEWVYANFWIDIYIIKPLEKAEKYHWQWDSWFILIVAIKWAWSTRRRRVIEALKKRSRYENKKIRAQLIKRSKEWENSTNRRRETRLKRCRERRWKHW